MLIMIMMVMMIMIIITKIMPIPMNVRSKAWVCGCSIAGWQFRIPLRAWMLVSCVCCVLFSYLIA